MKATKRNPQGTEYPCLMQNIDSDLVVLMTDPGSGTIVFANEQPNKIGEYSDRWDMELFVPCTGVVELSN